jgi:hypothetical protein
MLWVIMHYWCRHRRQHFPDRPGSYLVSCVNYCKYVMITQVEISYGNNSLGHCNWIIQIWIWNPETSNNLIVEEVGFGQY